MKEMDYLKFYNELARKYPEEDIVYRTPSGMLRKKFVKKLLEDYAKPPFIDIGCGGGVYLEDFEGKCFGLDIAFPALLRCKKRAPDAAIFQSYAEKANCIRAKYFKTILCSEVIEHIEDIDALLENLERILAPGGVLIITCPNYKGRRPKYESTEQISRFDIENVEYLHTAYKPEELEEKLAKLKMEIVKKGTFEKEIRYWRGVVIFISGIFPILFGKKTGEKLTLFFKRLVYFVLKYTGILYLISKITSEGARTFTVAKKKE